MKLNGNIKELFLRLLPVQIFIMATSSLGSLVNGLITGNYLTSDAMIALGLIGPMNAMLSSIANIVSGGSGIVCGRLMGKGDTKKINNLFTTAITILTIIGIIFSISIYAFADKLALIFGANELTLAYTTSYIKGLSFGVIPQLCIPCCMTFLQMCNKSNVSLFATICLALFYAIFGLINVKIVNGGIFGMGVSISLSHLFIYVLIIVYLMYKKDLVKYRLNLFDSKFIYEILKLGSPGSLAGILFSTRNVFINKYALQLAGTTAVNTLAINSSCFIQDALNVGASNTFTMLASIFAGERDKESLYDAYKVAFVYGEIILITKSFLILIFSEKIAILFGATGQVIEHCYSLLPLYAFSAPISFINLLFIGSNQSLGNITYCNIIYLITCIIAPLGCIVLLSDLMGITAVYSSYLLAEVVTLIAMIIICSYKNRHIIKNYKELILFPKNFTINDKFSMSINTIDEVVSISSKVQDFCNEHNIDSKRSMLAGLCMEEMAGNIVEHGFDKDNKENNIDIFVYIENDEISMRLRDNCVPFNPKEKLEMHSDDDPLKNIGIKMVSKISKYMNYQTTFGLNILTIKL